MSHDTVLGPLLFFVYINNMPTKVDLKCRLFADDSLIYRLIKTEEVTIALQQDLNKLQQWENLTDEIQS